MYSVSSSMLILLCISSRFYYLLRMFQLHSSFININIYIYIYIYVCIFSVLAIFHPHPCTVLGIFSLPIRLFTCVCQFLACKVFFVSIVTTFIYFLQLQSLPFSCVPATLLSHLLSARFCSKASAALFASACHEALYVQYCTKASSGTERLMVEFIKKMFPCMLPPKIIWQVVVCFFFYILLFPAFAKFYLKNPQDFVGTSFNKKIDFSFWYRGRFNMQQYEAQHPIKQSPCSFKQTREHFIVA